MRNLRLNSIYLSFFVQYIFIIWTVTLTVNWWCLELLSSFVSIPGSSWYLSSLEVELPEKYDDHRFLRLSLAELRRPVLHITTVMTTITAMKINTAIQTILLYHQHKKPRQRLLWSFMDFIRIR